MGTFPKLTLDGVIASSAWTPVPVTGITLLVPCEVVTVTFPLIFSEASGLNVTLSVVV